MFVHTHQILTRNNTSFHSLVVVSHNHMSFRDLGYWSSPPTITNNGPDKWVAAWCILFWGHEWPVDVLMLLQCWGEEHADVVIRHYVCWNTLTTHARKWEKSYCYGSTLTATKLNKNRACCPSYFCARDSKSCMNTDHDVCTSTIHIFDKTPPKHRTYS